jgi:L-ascorbate metabolism protein UlaG (beta-lactamase superfamily)
MEIVDFLKNIKWLGHAGFRIDAGRTIYIDPFEIGPGPPADLVLISHSHYDHCSPEDLDKIVRPDTVIVTEKSTAAKLSGNIEVLAPGDSVDLAGIGIEAVPAYNTDKAFHPRAQGWLGFVISVDGVRIYHTGDSDFIPEMAGIKADIALLPVSGTYVMDPEQAAAAARAINPAYAIPMHYGKIVGTARQAAAFKAALEGRINVHLCDKL